MPVYAMVTDDHSLHIREHRTVLATPESRENPDLVANITNHIMEHVSMLADPMLAPLLSVLGQATMAGAMQPPPGDPGMGSGGAPKPAGPGGAKLPDLPKNPSTQQPWNPVDGGNRQGPMDAGNPTGGAGGGGAA